MEEWEKILGRMGGTAATYWEGYFDSSGELLRQIGRIPGDIGNVFIIIIGELVAAKGKGYCDILGSLWRQKGRISGNNRDEYIIII